tara:strand:+ start:1103 stop:1810 length:708 start_codon:yes stop_codon:yes gene_type:complete
MSSDEVLCTICLEPINIIRPGENSHSIKYISPIIDESPIINGSPNLSPEIEDISPHQVNLSPVRSFDISSTESGDSQTNSPSIQQTYVETPELQTIVEQQIDYINPCECKNPVHIKCFLSWLSYKNTTNCEICNSQYALDIDVYNEYFRTINNEYDENNQNNQNNENNEYGGVNYHYTNNIHNDSDEEAERQYWLNTHRIMEDCIDLFVLIIKYTCLTILGLLIILLIIMLFYNK